MKTAIKVGETHRARGVRTREAAETVECLICSARAVAPQRAWLDRLRGIVDRFDGTQPKPCTTIRSMIAFLMRFQAAAGTALPFFGQSISMHQSTRILRKPRIALRPAILHNTKDTQCAPRKASSCMRPSCCVDSRAHNTARFHRTTGGQYLGDILQAQPNQIVQHDTTR